MTSSENLLTHGEIWDDSSLVNAWDEALQEYKKYHSIDATGENKQKIIRQAEEAEMQDAPDLNQVREEGKNTIEYQPSVEDGEFGKEGMEHEVAAVPHIVIPGVNTITVEKESDYKQQIQNPGINSGNKDYEKNLVEAPSDQSNARIPSQTNTQALPPPPPFPMNFVGDVKDNEALRNLMMSWYFAGYYTGLYEGQQQGRQQHSLTATPIER